MKTFTLNQNRDPKVRRELQGTKDLLVSLAYQDNVVFQERLVLREEEETQVYPDQKAHKVKQESEDHKVLEDHRDPLVNLEVLETQDPLDLLESLVQLV